MFHYTNFKAFENIMKTKTLWMTNVRDLDDKTERDYANKLIIKLIKNCDEKNVSELRDNLSVKDIENENNASLEAECYSTSFCYSGKNEVLWEQYANSNKGIAIEFNITAFENFLKKKGTEEILNFRPVFYPKNNFEMLQIIEISSGMKIGFIKELISKNRLSFAFNIARGIFKDPKFSGEEEIKLQFIDKYNDEYTKHSGIYLMDKMEHEKEIHDLGLDEEKVLNGKRRKVLNLLEVFSSKLIPSVILGKRFDGKLFVVRSILDTAGLIDTRIRSIDEEIYG